MTTEELNTIVQAVIDKINEQVIDFDVVSSTPESTDFLSAVRSQGDGTYQGVTLKWNDVANAVTREAKGYRDEAASAKTNVENMKASVEQTVSDFHTLAEEKKQEVQGVYKTDLNELNGDLSEVTNDYWVKSKNLYNKFFNGYSELTGKTYTNGLLSGWAIKRDDGTLYEASSGSTSHASYPFEVEGGKTVYVKRNSPLVETTALVFAWYDASFNFIGATLNNEKSVTLPQNARYLAFCDDRDYVYSNEYLTFTYDSTQTEYEDYYKSTRIDVEIKKVNTEIAEIKQNVLTNDSKYREFSALINGTDNVESFIFFTDPHLMGIGDFDYGKINQYINSVIEAQNSVPINYVLSGGDWLVNSDTKEQACYKLGIVDGLCRKLYNHKPILGNHDTGYQGANWAIDETKYKDDILSDETLRNLLFRQQGNLYYKFKGVKSTTFVLNTGIEWWDWLTDERIVQLQWLHDELLADNSEHKVIALHAISATETSEKYVFAQSIGKIIEAFNNKGVADITNFGASTYDFSNAVGKIDYVINGHSHNDFVTTLGGVPCITTTNMTSGDTPTFDIVLVDYDKLIINLVRIGSGTNRTVNLT